MLCRRKKSCILERYDVKAGRWPENRNECVLVLSIEGKISDQLAYTLTGGIMRNWMI